MAETAPIRPQRIIRANRETTGGLLMSVIRSLTTSRDSADRDRERLELEKGFQQCDSKLNELISTHGNDLYQVMTTFSRILTNLSKAKERLIDTRDKLLNCQKLLHCKRDELKKLWLEIVENRDVYNLLERVEQVASLPKQVEAYTEKKHYLHAGQCCVDGLRELEPNKNNQSNDQQPTNSLSNIEALQEVRTELLAKKEALFDKCIDELHRHLYSVATEQIRHRLQQDQINRAKSNQNDSDNSTAFIYDLTFNNNDNQSWNQQSDVTIGNARNDTNEESFDAYPEEDSRQFISMLTKCIGLLNKIPDAVKIIKERFDEEFVNVVIRTAHDILSTSRNTATNDSAHDKSSSLILEHGLSPTLLSNSRMCDSSSPVQSMHRRHQRQRQHSSSDLVVLTSSRLLGHQYDPFSHLNESDAASGTVCGELILPRQSIQLQQLFDQLMKQFYYVMQLHESTVLFNMKRIQCGLHAYCAPFNQSFDQASGPAATGGGVGGGSGSAAGGDVSNAAASNVVSFYTTMDIWTKIQILIQQLLDYYLDISQISGQTNSSIGLGSNINYNLVSSLLTSAAVNMLFGVGGGHGAGPHPGQTATGPGAQQQSSGADQPNNYSSFFLKRRPMVVAGAMNAMNVMMTTGKNTLSSSASAANIQGTTSTGNVDDVNAQNELMSGTMQSTMAAHHQPGAGAHSTGVVNAWRSPQANLFKFDHSTQAISWNSLLQQQSASAVDNDDQTGGDDDNETDGATGNTSKLNRTSQRRHSANINNRLFESLQLISSQSPDNLVLLYDSLLEHVDKCPLNSSKTSSEHRRSPISHTLQSYLCQSADKFTGQIRMQLNAMLEQAPKSLESGLTMAVVHHKPNSGQQRTYRLLESALLVDVALSELCVLMNAMKHYRQHYLSYICDVLRTFKDTCKRLYDTLTCHDTQTSSSSNIAPGTGDAAPAANAERRTILSAYWARNEDINRLLKSQPNWIQLETHSKPGHSHSQTSVIPRTTGTESSIESRMQRLLLSRQQMSTSLSFDECSPEDVRQRTASEIDILINLLSQEITRNELIWNEGQLRLLADMQQSLEWLSARCDYLVQCIRQSIDKEDEVYMATLNQLSSDLDEMAQLSLLVLHLEIRVHCCYHLQALDAQFFTTPAPVQVQQHHHPDLSDDARIMPLLEDLERMHQEISAAELSNPKMSYIFEGLGHLMATIFINSVMSVRRLKLNGVKRSCRAIYDIQRRLSTITKSRELALDYARQYFEMLLLTPDEILSGIIERGRQFKPKEYVSAITLLHQNRINNDQWNSGGAMSGSGAATATTNISFDQHQTQVSLKRLLDRLETILAEVTN